jgi:NAD(P)-dependent dehydrogenase (short-subunit alcohol dehydrogenase family)
MLVDLSGKIALVTGSSSPIRRAIATQAIIVDGGALIVGARMSELPALGNRSVE